MKKAVLIVFLLLAAVSGLWAGTAWWLGLKTEQIYHEMLEQASQVQYMKFKGESYSRGLFHSIARSEVELELPSDPSGLNRPIRLVLVQDIKHGPLPIGKSAQGGFELSPLLATIETRVELSQKDQSLLKELYSQVPELESMRSYTKISFNGGGEETFSIPSFNRIFGNDEKTAVDWKGLLFKLDFSPDFKRLTGSLSAPGLSVKARDLNLKINQIKSAFSFHDGTSGLTLGDSSFELSGLEFLGKKETGPYSLFIQGFSANGSNRESAGNIDCSFAVRAEKLKLDKALYGPGTFRLDIRNIDAASLLKLQKTIRELQTHAAQKSQQEMQTAMLSSYGEILPSLLSKSPEIEISQLEVKSPAGDLTAGAKVAYDADKSTAAINPLMLASAINAEGKVRISHELLNQVALNWMKDKIISERKERNEAPPSDQEIASMASERLDEQIKPLIAQNIIIEENGTYAASASYKAGEVVINGRPLPLNGLLP